MTRLLFSALTFVGLAMAAHSQTMNPPNPIKAPLHDVAWYAANSFSVSGVVADNEFSYSCTHRNTCRELNPLACGGCAHPTRWQFYSKDLFTFVPGVTGISYLAGVQAEQLKQRHSKWRWVFKGLEYGVPVAYGIYRWQGAKTAMRY